ncbi:MAG: DNA-3-methyladenine glycosylase I, partial [Bacteroidota bacterium]
MEAFENTYCYAIRNLDEIHRHYHDTEYGFPAQDDNDLFKRLMLEVNQAGLSWTTILKKKPGILEAYDQFDIPTVAHYGEADRERLLKDPRIIRNQLKVNAAIHNAQQILHLQEGYGSFKSWLDHHFPKSRDEWVKLFKKTFKFTGGEITNEFLMGCGYLEGAHHPDCPIYQKMLFFAPFWLLLKHL